MNTDSVTFDEHGLECLDGQTVQGWRTVQEDRVALGHFFQDVPNFRRAAFDHLLGRADGVDVAQFLQATDDEWFKQHERHFLGQTALAEFQFRSDNNNGTTGVIDAFAEQVLTETSAFALEHVGQGLERTIAGTSHSAAVAAVVEEGIDGFLEHALLIANDDVWRLQLQEVLQTIVPA